MNSATIAKKDKTRETVKKAYSGGKTEDEAQKILHKQGISLSSHQKHRADLVKDGNLTPKPHHGKGKGPTQFIPTDELLLPPNTQEIDLSKEEATLPVSKGVLVSMVIDQAKEIVEAIEKDDAWKNKRKIRKICNEIRPVIGHIAYLESLGYSLTLPWHFFEKENPPLWKGLFGWKDLRGTGGIPVKIAGADIEGVNEKEDRLYLNPEFTNNELYVIIYPSLPEWKWYFMKVIEELDSASKDSKQRKKEKQDKTKGI
ncbi:MAG: hypothetical protein GXX95_00980 [Methanomassiliicoccus sp.]|nr:hypothetical protein [Methanomassiliicoccus sp.]